MLEYDFDVVVTDPHKFHVGSVLGSSSSSISFLPQLSCSVILPHTKSLSSSYKDHNPKSIIFSWLKCYIQFRKDTNTQKRPKHKAKRPYTFTDTDVNTVTYD